MNTKKWKRGISLLLCMGILLGNFPGVSFAAENDGLCEHHTEHTDCGYAEGESVCSYVCQICAQEPAETTEPDETTEATELSAFTEVATAYSDDTAAPTESGTEPTVETTANVEAVTEPKEETIVASEKVYVQTENVTSQPALSDTNTISHTWDETTKTLTITGEGPMPDYYLNSSQQYGIYPPWFGCSAEAEKIVISEGITYVGEYAFYDLYYNCSNMKELVLADSVEEIGSAAFLQCPSLEKITIGKGLKAVHGTNFRYCFDLKEVHISDLSAYCGINYDSTPFTAGYAAYLYSNGERITDLVIPDGVVAIGKRTFQNCSLNSVTLPNTVTTLGQYAFANNPFVEFEVPSGVTVLSGTFADCNNLQSIILPDGLQTIAGSAFKNCQNLQSVTVPDTVTEIGERAFSGCTSMKTIELSDSMTSIGAYAFSGCALLENIEFPEKLETVGEFAFNGCTSLKSIDLPEGLSSMEKGAFMGCSALNAVEIPSGLTVINPMSFSGCTGLTSITLPDTLTSIGVSAFHDCGSLTAPMLPNSVTVLGESAFKNCSSLQSIKLSESLTKLSVEVFSGCTSLAIVELPASISAIQQEAFNGCSQLTEIVFMGDAPSEIGELAFGGVKATCYFSGDNETFTADFCAKNYGGDLTWRRIGEETDSVWCGAHITWELSDTGVLTLTGAGAMYDYLEEDIVYAPWYDSRESITQIVLSDGITEIGVRAFYNCSNATSVTIPTSITVIGDRAFEGCAMTAITWPEHLNTIGNYAFSATKLSGVLELPGELVSVGTGAFAQCKNITDVVLPDSMTDIPDEMFNECSKLVRVSFPQPLKSIGSSVFSGCYKLNSVALPEGLISIGDYAFSGCGATEWGGYSFTSVTLPSTLQSIGKGAFNWCQSLVSINIPEGVEAIRESTFYRCEDLSELTIPASVKTIESRAFEYCYSLFTLIFCGDAPQFGTTALECIYGKSTDFMTAYYPAGNATWTEDVMQNYGGRVTWVPYEPSDGTEGSGGSDGEGTSGGDNEESGGNETEGGTDGSGSNSDGTTSGGDSGDASGTGTGGEGSNSGTGGTGNSCTDGHTFGEWEETVTPDCENTGEKRRQCTVCGGYEVVTLDALGHTEVTDAAVEATCTEDGLTEGSHCSVCGEIIVAQEEVPAGHTVENGICTVCGVYGTCGENLTWAFDVDTSMLVISGTGKMEDFSYPDYAPWFGYKEQINTVDIKSGVTRIGAFAFKDYSNVETIAIPDSVTLFGDCVFLNCSSLTCITLPSNIKRISNQMFQGCQSLTSIIIPDSVTRISQNAFSECSSLTSINIPASVTNIEGAVFSNCSNLTGMWVDENNTAYSNDSNGVLFDKNKTKLIQAPGKISGSYIVPGSVTNIGTSAFSGCSSLENITLPDSLAELSWFSFYDCSSLKSISLPQTLTVIEENTFANCTSLTNVILPDKLTAIYDYAFKNCSSLENIELPQTLNSIYYGAFYGCSSLTSIAIPAVATSIGDIAFYDCTALKEISFAGDAPDFLIDVPLEYPQESRTFHNVTATAYYPAGNPTWTADVMQNYGGTITWVPYKRVVMNTTDLNNQTSVWIDGMEYAVQTDGAVSYIDLPDGNAKTMVAYTYYVGDTSDVHTQYPTGMKVWTLNNQDGLYTATRVEELDDILQYSGSSIRATGKQGIRMITAIEKARKNALISGGLAGYTLKEYGTVVAWASQLDADNPLALGASYAKSNYAYKKGVANPVLAYDGDLMQYTNVLVGFSLDKCKDDIAMRPYMILADAAGNEITLYGGTVERSIGYIAYQNRNAFAPGTEAYAYIWEIIHAVYDDAYDAEYQGE